MHLSAAAIGAGHVAILSTIYRDSRLSAEVLSARAAGPGIVAQVHFGLEAPHCAAAAARRLHGHAVGGGGTGGMVYRGIPEHPAACRVTMGGDPMLLAHVHFTVVPARRASAPAALCRGRAVRGMPGNVMFVPFADPTDPARARVIDEWQTAATFEGYLAS